MQEKIETFYKDNKINMKIVDKIEGLQVSSFYAKINTYNMTTINKIKRLRDALCLYLMTDNINVRLDYKSGCIVFEIPKKERTFLKFDELNKDIKHIDDELFLNVGVDTNNLKYSIDLTTTPHLLVAGTTGSGKSVFINSILTSLFLNYHPLELETILIDIKQVEFSIYRDIPHLLCEPVTTLDGARKVLNDVIIDINERYKVLNNSGYRNIKEYNRNNVSNKMAFKLIVIDELAELLMLESKNKLKNKIEGNETIEQIICRIAQIGRACGVHLIVATQRPSTDVVSGLIKSNIPSRVCLSVASATDSKVILDEVGGENLSGKGDLLIKLIGNDEATRLQSAFISDEEQRNYIKQIKNKYEFFERDNINNNNEEEQDDYKYDEDYLKGLLERNFRVAYEKNDYNKTTCILYDLEEKSNVLDVLSENDRERAYLDSIYFKVLNKISNEYKKVNKINNSYNGRAYNSSNRASYNTKKSNNKGMGLAIGGGIMWGIIDGFSKAIKK